MNSKYAIATKRDSAMVNQPTERRFIQDVHRVFHLLLRSIPCANC
jgi:hypothetical protein